MNLPGNMANPPAMRAPIIVPVMNAACLRTFPRRIETTATTMLKIVPYREEVNPAEFAVVELSNPEGGDRDVGHHDEASTSR